MNGSAAILRQRRVSNSRPHIPAGQPHCAMPTWDEVAEKQRDTLQGAGVVASVAGAIAALLAGKAGRVQLALLDRSNLASDDWRKVFLLGRLPAMGKALEDWSIIDEHGDVPRRAARHAGRPAAPQGRQPRTS